MGSALAIALTDSSRTRWSITAVREAVGVSQEQLAAYAGVSLSTVRRWEDGTSEPSAANLIDVMNGCGYQVVVMTTRER